MPVLSLFVIFLVLALLATSLFFAVQSPECVTLTLGDSHGFAVSCDGTQPSIPRQVFLTTKDKATMRTWERKNIKKCKSVNPGWAFNLYNDTEINALPCTTTLSCCEERSATSSGGQRNNRWGQQHLCLTRQIERPEEGRSCGISS